jgi:hypothetical protein
MCSIIFTIRIGSVKQPLLSTVLEPLSTSPLVYSIFMDRCRLVSTSVKLGHDLAHLSRVKDMTAKVCELSFCTYLTSVIRKSACLCLTSLFDQEDGGVMSSETSVGLHRSTLYYIYEDLFLITAVRISYSMDLTLAVIRGKLSILLQNQMPEKGVEIFFFFISPGFIQSIQL